MIVGEGWFVWVVSGEVCLLSFTLPTNTPYPTYTPTLLFSLPSKNRPSPLTILPSLTLSIKDFFSFIILFLFVLNSFPFIPGIDLQW